MAPGLPSVLAVSGMDTGTKFGLGDVFVLSQSRLVYFFRVRVLPGDLLDRLEVETVAVSDVVSAPLLVAA